MTWLNNLLTESDNTTPCIVRIVAALGSANGLGLTAFDVVVRHVHFDVQAYGVGFGAILAAVGAALKWKPESKA